VNTDPLGFGGAGLTGVSCTDVADCTAVGGTATEGPFAVTSASPATSLALSVGGSQTYGSSHPTFSTTSTPPTGDTLTGTLTCTTVGNPARTISSTLAAGGYAINGSSCSGLTLSGPTASNYELSYSGGTFTVNKAALVVTANNQMRTVLAANPALTYSVKGFVNGDTAKGALTGSPKLSTTATTTSLPGSYPIAIAQGSLTALNYTFTFVRGTLTVTAVANTGLGVIINTVVTTVLDLVCRIFSQCPNLFGA
jgi:hypothetical protein